MPVRLVSRADRSAWNGLTHGFFRGAVLVLTLVFAVIAGSPQDRFPARTGGDSLAVSAGSSDAGPASRIASAAMADPDDGLDEASGIVVPSPVVGRPVARSDRKRTTSTDRAATLVPERPPRTV